VRTIQVTGAGGYVGGRLVQALGEEGAEVRAIVREPAPRLGIPETVCDLATADEAELVDACAGVETIVHLAGENEVMAAREPAAALASTLVATERLFEAAAKADVRRLVYLSTVHVYGERMVPGAELTEELRAEPRSSYAISRLASEHVAASLAGGAELVILRLTNSVGAPDAPEVDRWTLVANDLCRQGATSGRLELRSSGVQWRDFVALGDVCSIIAAAGRVGPGALPPGTYNLGSGTPTTVRALAEMVQDAFERAGEARPPLTAPDLPDERPEPYLVSVERAARHGLRAATPLEQAVEETVRFCLEHREEIA
jgi:UDP-glucose 4-epimerase